MSYRNVEDRKRNRADRQRRIVDYVTEYKRQASCAHCGERHVACLHFHHRNAEEKDFSISTAVFHGWGIERIMAEIAKCDVLCANCHAKHHWEERMGAQTSPDYFSLIELDKFHGASQSKKQACSA